jgi:hypothetical protein
MTQTEVQKAGLLRELRHHRYDEKPSERRQRSEGIKAPGNVNRLYLASKGSGAMKAFTSGSMNMALVAVVATP